MMQTSKPMAGKLVLDLTQGIAGPYAARLMAEHGARVIKIEPPGGDWIRRIGGGPGASVNYLYYNFGKESVELDIKTEEGLAAVRAIAAKADVMMESARPGVTAKRGLGFDAVQALNPAILYLSVSGYGLEGPEASAPMTDTIAQAFTGMMSINAGMDGIPHKMNTTIVDAICGLYGFQTVSMALMAGVTGQHLDVSLAQAAAAIMGPKVLEFAHFGHSPASPNPPAGSYATKDGWIALTLVRDSHFVAMADVMGRPDLPNDPRFATFATRLEHLDALVAIMAPILKQRTTAEWVPLFREGGVLASRINDFGMWLEEPQTKASHGAPQITVLPGVTAPVPRTPGRAMFDTPCPEQGADTARVLVEFAAE